MMPRRPGNDTKPIEKPKLPKLAHRAAFEITDKMPKPQVVGATMFNEMRERLLLLGEMEEK